MFFYSRFCKLGLDPIGFGGLNDVVKATMPEEIEGVTEPQKELFVRPVTWERILAEFETNQNLRSLQEELVKHQAVIQRQDLLGKILADSSNQNNETKVIIDLLMQEDQTNGIERAEQMVRSFQKEHATEYHAAVERYNNDPRVIREKLLAGELSETEANVLLQKALEKHPTITKLASKLGLEMTAVSGFVAGAFAKTGKIPQSTTELLWAMRDGAESLLNYKTLGRAAEKMQVKDEDLRSVYGMNIGVFTTTIEECITYKDDKESLQKLLDTPGKSADARRIIKRFLSGDSSQISGLTQVSNAIAEKKEQALKELDKTFTHNAAKEGLPISATQVRQKSLDFFRNDLTVARMMTLLYSLKEDRETLLSYTTASLLATLPKGLSALSKLHGWERILNKPDLIAHLTEGGSDMSRLGRMRGLSRAVQEGALMHSHGYRLDQAASAAQHSSTQKTIAKSHGFGKALRYLGVGGLAATEIYNVQTGRSKVEESLPRFAGGMLRFVPLIGTGLDFTEAFSGQDQLNGQKLTSTERISRFGWGIVGGISDVLMLVPGVGLLGKGAVASLRGASLAKAAARTRTLAMGAGIGMGVAPILVAPEGRAAVGAAVTVGVGTASASLGLLKLLGGTGESGAGDLMVATTEMEKNMKRGIQSATTKTAETVRSAAEATKHGWEALRGELERKLADWNSDSRNRLMDNVQRMSDTDRTEVLEALDDEKISDKIREATLDVTLADSDRGRVILGIIREGNQKNG
jgi:hypothetical protein